MSSQGNPEKKVIMVDVQPGEKTGVYYMPICNLPFGTSWQDFKDWLRVDCDVDHVELFQSSTSGWIRLRGEANFNKAWARLQRDYFRNRAIIASDKNRTESIKIKELVYANAAQYGTPTPWELAASPAQGSDVLIPPSRSCTEEAVSSTSVPSHDPEFGRSLVLAGSPIGLEAIEAYDGITGSNFNNLMAAQRCHILTYTPGYGYYEPLTPLSLMPAEPCHGSSKYESTQTVDSLQISSHQPNQSACYRNESNTENPIVTWAQTPHNPNHYSKYPEDETCQAVVTSIQRKSCQHEVSQWIRHQIGEYVTAIIDLDIPLDGSRGSICGHAVITLAHTKAAEATVRILDQKLFQGRVVSARLAVRDVSDVQRSIASKDTRSSEHNWQGQSREPGLENKRTKQTKPTRKSESKSRDTKQKDLNSPTPTSSTNLCCATTEILEKSTHASRPVIAHGSSARRREQRK